MERLSKKDYYLNIAAEVAKRSTCMRRQYGAVIVKDDRIIATGYNGPARGSEHCEACVRDNLPHNSGYTSDCPAVHAETNALLSAGRESIGATLYLAGWANGERIASPTPCVMCSRLIQNAQIKEVIGN